MRQQDARDPGELLARAGFQRRAAGIEQDIREVHDQPARGFAGVEHLIELLTQLVAKRRFLAMGLLDSGASLLRLRLCGEPRGLGLCPRRFGGGPSRFSSAAAARTTAPALRGQARRFCQGSVALGRRARVSAFNFSSSARRARLFRRAPGRVPQIRAPVRALVFGREGLFLFLQEINRASSAV